MSIINILLVGVGSCLGGIFRYLLSKIVQTYATGTFPWGTLAVNVAGCLLIGLVYGLIDRGFQISDGVRLFLTVGFCGGFTTFSTFAHENFLLFNSGNLLLFIGYTALSFVLGFGMIFCGYFLTRIPD